jgi:histone H3/H4
MEEESIAEEKDLLIVASKTKNYIKNQGCMVSGDALEALNRKIYELIDNAVKRTRENKRTTLRPHDF